jgi:hypothetical protein
MRRRKADRIAGRRKASERLEDCDERRRLELALDEALENTFPASDPISIEQPVPPAPVRDSG